jgi:hypothetical protein
MLQKVRIVTADVSYPATVAMRCDDGEELKGIIQVDFHHHCAEMPTATIEVYCERIEVIAEGELVTTYMGKKYRLVECPRD